MATTPSIGTYGEQLDLKVKQGSTFGPMTVTMTDVDLTSCLIRGQIRKKALDAAIVDSFACDITDAAGGVFTFGLTDEQTAAITCDESIVTPGSQYVYDIEMEDSVGRVTPLLYGKLIMFREVTR